MRIKELNAAKRISLNNLFWSIIIDKTKGTIIQTRQCETAIYNDVTKQCEAAENAYTLGDIVVETPYTGSIVMSKILHNSIDKRCKSFLKTCGFTVTIES